MILEDKAEQFQLFCVHWPWLRPVRVLARCESPSSPDRNKPAMAKAWITGSEGPKIATNTLGSMLQKLSRWRHGASGYHRRRIF